MQSSNNKPFPNIKNTDFFFHNSWRILFADNLEKRKFIKPPSNISETEKSYAKLLSTTDYKKFKSTRNRFFKKICDYTHDVLKNYKNDSFIISNKSCGEEVYGPESQLFYSKKDRSVNQNNNEFQTTQSLEKAKRILKIFSEKSKEMKQNDAQKQSYFFQNDLKNNYFEQRNDDFVSLSLHEKKTHYEKPKVANIINSKNIKVRKVFSSRLKNNAKDLKEKLLNNKNDNQILKSDEEISNEDRKKPPSFYVTRQPKSRESVYRSSFIDQEKNKVIFGKPNEKVVRIIDNFIENYFFLKNSLKYHSLNEFILAKTKHMKVLKKEIIYQKEVRGNINHDYFWNIINKASFSFGKNPNETREKIFDDFLFKHKLITELEELNQQLITVITSKNKQMLNFYENDIYDNYQNYEENNRNFNVNNFVGKKKNFYDNNSFKNDVKMVKSDFDSYVDIAQKMDEFENAYGECKLIGIKEKKIMKNIDFFYKNIKKRFENFNSKNTEKTAAEGPYYLH